MSRCDQIWDPTVTLQENLEASEDSSVVFFVEVDLKYPQHLHGIFSGLHLALEQPEISSSSFFEYARAFKMHFNQSAKLVETLFDKKTCHYEVS